MQNRLLPLVTIVLIFALAVAGCGVFAPSAAPATVAPATATAPTASQGSSAPEPTKVPPSATQTPGAPSAAPASTNAEAAIKTVIEQANAAQERAFALNDPTPMKATASSQYYAELSTINQSLRSNGVSGIRLVKIEWGAITVTGDRAEAITYETWQTSFANGATDQSRDKNVYTLALEQGAWKILSDEHPDSGTTPPGGAEARAPTEPVTPASPLSMAQTDTSRNWSGYAATGGTFTSVTGTWTVPESTPSDAYGASAAWVGIGGVTGRDLIQAGTLQENDGTGRVRYRAWVETLPASVEFVPLSVRPGDSVTVTITQQETDHWLITIDNRTTGKRYQTTEVYKSTRSSAEWIQEAPSSGRRTLPLDSFGSVQFSGASAVMNGETRTIAQTGAEPITLVDSRGNPLASPSGLTADGGGFSVSHVSGG